MRVDLPSVTPWAGPSMPPGSLQCCRAQSPGKLSRPHLGIVLGAWPRRAISLMVAGWACGANGGAARPLGAAYGAGERIDYVVR